MDTELGDIHTQCRSRTATGQKGPYMASEVKRSYGDGQRSTQTDVKGVEIWQDKLTCRTRRRETAISRLKRERSGDLDASVPGQQPPARAWVLLLSSVTA